MLCLRTLADGRALHTERKVLIFKVFCGKNSLLVPLTDRRPSSDFMMWTTSFFRLLTLTNSSMSWQWNKIFSRPLPAEEITNPRERKILATHAPRSTRNHVPLGARVRRQS
jgi:hypothetical protein